MVEIDQSKKMSMGDLDLREEGRARPEPNEELQKIHIRVVVEKFTFIGQGLLEAMQVDLMSLLRINSDLFTWAIEDMLGIDLRVICHKLAIDPKVQPVVQKQRKLEMEKPKVAM